MSHNTDECTLKWSDPIGCKGENFHVRRTCYSEGIPNRWSKRNSFGLFRYALHRPFVIAQKYWKSNYPSPFNTVQ